MNKSHFFDLVNHPEELNKETLQSLTEIVTEYPWFQVGRMLLVKNLHMLDHVRYNSELKVAAAHISDRARLFDLIHKPVEKAEETIEETCIDQAESKGKDILPLESDTVDEVDVKVDGGSNEKKPSFPSTSSVGISTKVKSLTDYFQSSDVYQTGEGMNVDFTIPVVKGKVPEITDTPDDLKIEGADLPGYDTPETTAYQLSEGVAYHEVTEENRSFSDWLNMLQHVPIQQEAILKEKPVQKRSQQIIDNFLTMERPRLIPVEKTEQEPSAISDQVASAGNDSDDLMSETLASIYIKQKYYRKAISIFDKLRLKYPEKNTYFADQISELEKLIINNKK
ncbi:MAG: hypothetical protein JEZ14_02115 [Marinilabiliaceae bacterium]|nr:hypothetical protein [Marinilabiliaceae bacterium]